MTVKAGFVRIAISFFISGILHPPALENAITLLDLIP